MINAVDKQGWTPLDLASCHDWNLAVVRLLLDNGANVEGGLKGIPLRMSCSRGSMEFVSLLLENGATVNSNNPLGEDAPLSLASKYGRLEVVYRLLVNDANVYAKNLKNGYTALHWACQTGHLDIARVLVDMATNVNETNFNGSTPLHCACHGGKIDVVRYLVLDKDADLHVRNRKGYCPLDLARLKNRHAVVQFLESEIQARAHTTFEVRNHAHLAHFPVVVSLGSVLPLLPLKVRLSQLMLCLISKSPDSRHTAAGK
jgi:ankyrin repeat protein